MFPIDRTTAARIEEAQAWRAIHYAQAQHRLRPDLKVAVEAVAGAHLIYAGPQGVVNRAAGLGMSGPVADVQLDAVEEFFRSRGAPVVIDLCPLADRSLIDLLRRRRYTLDSFLNMLALPLDESVAYPSQGQDIRIERVAPTDLDLWVSVTARGFEATETPDALAFEILNPNARAANARCFLAWIGDEPVGGGSMYIHNGVAEFGGAATRIAYRGRGVQSALLRHRLAAAYAEGCDLATTATRPGSDSQRNIERAGFRLVYTEAMMQLAHNPDACA
jgi:GNAT superfamily N-acetyltransferase